MTAPIENQAMSIFSVACLTCRDGAATLKTFCYVQETQQLISRTEHADQKSTPRLSRQLWNDVPRHTFSSSDIFLTLLLQKQSEFRAYTFGKPQPLAWLHVTAAEDKPSFCLVVSHMVTMDTLQNISISAFSTTFLRIRYQWIWYSIRLPNSYIKHFYATRKRGGGNHHSYAARHTIFVLPGNCLGCIPLAECNTIVIFWYDSMTAWYLYSGNMNKNSMFSHCIAIKWHAFRDFQNRMA